MIWLNCGNEKLLLYIVCDMPVGADSCFHHKAGVCNRCGRDPRLVSVGGSGSISVLIRLAVALVIRTQPVRCVVSLSGDYLIKPWKWWFWSSTICKNTERGTPHVTLAAFKALSRDWINRSSSPLTAVTTLTLTLSISLSLSALSHGSTMRYIIGGWFCSEQAGESPSCHWHVFVCVYFVCILQPGSI